jgi:RHS repeat-associated protein
LRYPGQRADPVTGLYYNYFRDYEAATGRYVKSDPIGLRGGTSTFSYAGGAALATIDPTGLLFSSVDAACVQDPSFCLELIGGYARFRSRLDNRSCDYARAEYWGSVGALAESM